MNERPIEAEGTVPVPLHRIAHGRTGDKGNRLNVSVIAHRPDLFPVIRAEVTEERVRRLFADRRPGPVVRYELPLLHALNFVIDDVLEGGVNLALNLDGHGKSLSFLVLSMPVRCPRALLPTVDVPTPCPTEPPCKGGKP